MRKRLQKFLTVVLTLAVSMVYFASIAQAGLMGEASVELTNPAPTGSSTYNFKMKLNTTQTPQAIKLTFLTQATGGATPAGENLAAAAMQTGTFDGVAQWSNNLKSGGGNDFSEWAVDATAAAGGILALKNANIGSINSGTEVDFALTGITNPSLTADHSGCQYNPTNHSSGTCFILVQTYNDVGMAGGALVDNVTLGFAVNTSVDVKVKVDPALTFTVVGVAQNTAVATANTVDHTTAGSDYNKLDFATLTPNVIREMAQSLTVNTNAVTGYYVYSKLTTQLTGTYVTNNIDKYVGNAATNTSPQAWTSPTNNVANVNTGYIGFNTTERDIPGVTWGATLWSPLDNSTTTAGDPVMYSSGPDLGGVATVVSYAIEVDVYQPSDSYSGVLQYNCVPKY